VEQFNTGQIPYVVMFVKTACYRVPNVDVQVHKALSTRILALSARAWFGFPARCWASARKVPIISELFAISTNIVGADSVKFSQCHKFDHNFHSTYWWILSSSQCTVSLANDHIRTESISWTQKTYFKIKCPYPNYHLTFRQTSSTQQTFQPHLFKFISIKCNAVHINCCLNRSPTSHVTPKRSPKAHVKEYYPSSPYSSC